MSAPVVVGQGWAVSADPVVGSRPVGARWTATTLAGHLVAMGSAAGGGVALVVGEPPEGWHRGSTLAEVIGGTSWADAWRLKVTTPGGEAVTVVLLARDTGRVAGPWQGCGAGEVLGALRAWHRLTGVWWADSTGRTCERLILSTHPRSRGGVQLDQDPVVPEVCAGGALEDRWASWSRPLTPGEVGRSWVHAFDVNAQYLAAWSTVELGHGEPAHLAPRSCDVVFNPKTVGVWRIPGAANLPNPLPLLPRPWLDREWFTTPTVVRMLEVLGDEVAPLITEAWVWPKHSRFLRGAAELLRDTRAAARAELREQQANAPGLSSMNAVTAHVSRMVTAGVVADAVKDCYRVETGRFAMGRRTGSGWARPDWGHLVRAQARVNLHRRLAKLGAAPFAVATDAVLFASDEPDGRCFARSVGLVVGDGIGEWSHDATVAAAFVLPSGPVTRSGVQLVRAVGQVSRG